MTEEFTLDDRPSGITEHLRRWGWKLPEGYQPVSLEDCHCRELVLVVSDGRRNTKINSDGTLHKLHPRTSSLGLGEHLDEELHDRPVTVLKLDTER